MDRLKRFFKNTTRSEWGYYIYGAGVSLKFFKTYILTNKIPAFPI